MIGLKALRPLALQAPTPRPPCEVGDRSTQCIIAQYAVEMRVCAEKNCGADISNRRGNAKRCLECAKNKYWECERAYFKSSKGRAAQKKYRQTSRRRALQKEYRAGL